MPDGQIVLVTTEPLEAGEPLRTIYYVAEEDATKAEAILGKVIGPPMKRSKRSLSSRKPP